MGTITRREIFGGAAALVAARLMPPVGGRHNPNVVAAKPHNLVVGAGGWCWFQSPRAAMDADGTLWLGSTQGTGAALPGSVDVSQVDVPTMRVVRRTSLGIDRVDDHTSPSVLLTPKGLLVGWAPHKRVDWLEIGPLDGPRTRVARPGSLVAPGRGMAYVSAHLVGDELWALYRGEGFSWNLLTSPDGTSWVGRGLVVASPVAGQRPYLHAASDGHRLHIVVSDGNPSEFRGTAVSAGTVSADLRVTDAAGRPVGAVGTAPPSTRSLTRLVTGRDGRTEGTDADGWLCDLRVIDHRPTALLSVRDSWPTGTASVGRWRHEYRWARQRGTGRWTVEHLAWAGSELYSRQPDYSGLAALDPTDPTRVVISTNVHPVGGNPLVSSVDGRVHHELFEGRRTGEARWRWTPITTSSSEDNLRPIITANGPHRATAWMRGTYRAWNDFSTHLLVRNA